MNERHVIRSILVVAGLAGMVAGQTRPASLTPDAAQNQPATPRAARQVAPLPAGFIDGSVTLPRGGRRKYVVFVPPQYDRDPDHRWPVILFLHGSGECGTDGRRHLGVGLPKEIVRRTDRFPFIAVMPQAKDRWFRGEDAAAAWMALDAVLKAYRTDRDRVYCTGLSMGGFGTWELAAARPDVFAAIAPVCGVAPLDYLENIRHLPVWAFHGALDTNVPVAASREAIAKLKAAGASPRYTEYPDLKHKCWDRVYSGNGLYRWLLAQRRPAAAPREINYRFRGGQARVWWLALEAEPSAPADEAAQVRARVDEKGRVTITTRGVRSWALMSKTDPLKPGDRIAVVWNGIEVFNGPFTGVVAFRPTSQPTTRPSGS